MMSSVKFPSRPFDYLPRSNQVALLAVTSIGWSSSIAALSWIQDVDGKRAEES